MREAEKHAALKEKMESARREADGEDLVWGMVIDDGVPADDHNRGGANVEEVPAKMSQRKTQAQRKKAARLLTEVCLFTVTSFIIQSLTWFLETCSGRTCS